MLKTNKINSKHIDIDKIEQLYNDAFPIDERAPFFVLTQKIDENKGILLAFYDNNDNFIGFGYVIKSEKLCFIFYLAVLPQYRNQGYGSEMLKIIVKECSPTVVGLNIEPLDEEATNMSERIRRAKFYERNGFKDLGYKTKDGPLWYEMYSSGEFFPKETYISLLEDFFGKEIYHKYVRMFNNE